MFLFNFLLSMPGGMEWVIILFVMAFVLAFVIFWIYTIVEIAKSKFSDESIKIIWLLIVILLGFIGSIIYWIFGRSNRILLNDKQI